MGDNHHPLNLEETEQDILESNLSTLTTSVNNNTSAIAGIDTTTINNKLSGGISSGLKTLIEGNDTDIANIKTKTDFISISQNCDLDQIESDTATNNSKNGITSTEQSKLSNISVSSSVNLNTMNNSITTNTNGIDAIELKTDFISITQNCDLDQIESDTASNMTNITNLFSQTSGVGTSGLKSLITTNTGNIATNTTAIATNLTSNNTQNTNIATNTGNIATNTGNISSLTTSTTNRFAMTASTDMKTAIDLNTAKTTTQWSNNGSEVYINQNVGINNSNPNVNLEIGSGTTAPVRLRLNGSNGSLNSSEIIFTDNLQGANPDFYQGATIRFNSLNNRLEINTDNGNDNVTEPALYIYRGDTPYCTMQNLFSTDLSVQNCNLRPETRYIYGRRVNTTTDTDSDLLLTTSTAGGRDLVFKNILVHDMTYNSSGIFTVSITGLYHVIACIQADCGPNAESILTLCLKDAGNNNILKARSHISRAESNNNTAMQLNMNAIARLVAGTNYNFNASSDNGGSAIIQNDEASCNSLIIKGVILENTTTVPTNWGVAV